jgi:hypothetical protein
MAVDTKTDAGYRRAMLSTQGRTQNLLPELELADKFQKVDDMFLTTKLWTSPDPSGNYRVVPSDLQGHIPWMTSINSRLPPGSNYTIELGHNGNGNIGICNCCVLPCLNETFVHPKRSIDSTPNEALVGLGCLLDCEIMTSADRKHRTFQFQMRRREVRTHVQSE